MCVQDWDWFRHTNRGVTQQEHDDDYDGRISGLLVSLTSLMDTSLCLSLYVGLSVR